MDSTIIASLHQSLQNEALYRPVPKQAQTKTFWADASKKVTPYLLCHALGKCLHENRQEIDFAIKAASSLQNELGLGFGSGNSPPRLVNQALHTLQKIYGY